MSELQTIAELVAVATAIGCFGMGVQALNERVITYNRYQRIARSTRAAGFEVEDVPFWTGLDAWRDTYAQRFDALLNDEQNRIVHQNASRTDPNSVLGGYWNDQESSNS